MPVMEKDKRLQLIEIFQECQHLPSICIAKRWDTHMQDKEKTKIGAVFDIFKIRPYYGLYDDVGRIIIQGREY